MNKEDKTRYLNDEMEICSKTVYIPATAYLLSICYDI